MKSKINKYLLGSLIFVVAILASCTEIDIPEHKLDVEFKYELTCSESILKYVVPEVTITDTKGRKQVINIEEQMWIGNGHKTWNYSVHYDSLDVTSTMTVRYIPKENVVFEDETGFDSSHNIGCLIIVKEDGNGARNNYTIIPDYPAAVNVKADALQTFVEELKDKSFTRGGKVDTDGEISKIETN